MKTVTLSLKQFADLYGVSGQAVRKQLAKGVLYSPMVNARKIGHSWVIDVLTTWYESKQS